LPKREVARAICENRVQHVDHERFALGGMFAAQDAFGALAQLGEHLLCKQRVIGSIPIGSTIHLKVKSLRIAKACPPVLQKS
jgi:hypothetical protein